MPKPDLAHELLSERMVSRALIVMAKNLAAQLAIADGGDPTTVRAVLIRAMDELGTLPRDPAEFGLIGQHLAEPNEAFAAAKVILVERTAEILKAAATAVVAAKSAKKTRQ